MDMSKHTPGPWTIDDKAPNLSSVSIRGANKFAVCACRLKGPDGRTTGDTIREGKGNARLIAAAPDLLMALKDIAADADAGRLVYDDHELRDLLEKLRDEARAAIAKAEGGS